MAAAPNRTARRMCVGVEGKKRACVCRAEGPRGELRVWRVEQLPGAATQRDAEERMRSWARATIDAELATRFNSADRSATLWSAAPGLAQRLEAGAHAAGVRLNVQPGPRALSWTVRGCDPPAGSHQHAAKMLQLWSGQPARAFVLRFECQEKPLVVWSTRADFGDKLLAGGRARGVLLDVRPRFSLLQVNYAPQLASAYCVRPN